MVRRRAAPDRRRVSACGDPLGRRSDCLARTDRVYTRKLVISETNGGLIRGEGDGEDPKRAWAVAAERKGGN